MVYATGDKIGPRRLRLGMVGGGRNAFIGAVHRMALRLDDRAELVAGALSSDPENARLSGVGYRHRRGTRLFRLSARWPKPRPSGRTASRRSSSSRRTTYMRRSSRAFLEAGIDVICDKPLSADTGGGGRTRGACEKVRARLRRHAEQHRLRHGASRARTGRLGRARQYPHSTRRIHPGLADAADRRRRPEAGRMAHRPGARRPVRMPCRHRRACLQPCAFRLGPGAFGSGRRPHHLRSGTPARRQRPCADALCVRRARRAGRQPGLARQLQPPVASRSMATRPASNGTPTSRNTCVSANSANLTLF